MCQAVIFVKELAQNLLAAFVTGAMSAVRCSGTKRLVALTSWLPVPRIPRVSQFSMICASFIGKAWIFTTGMPLTVLGSFPSMTTPSAMNQSACLQLLAKGN